MTGKKIMSVAALLGLASFSTMTFAQAQCAAPPVQQAPIAAAPNAVEAIIQESFESDLGSLSYDSGFVWHKSTRAGTVDQGYQGSGALQFRFPEGNNGMSEQRFSFGQAYPEVWIRYWVKVPNNWRHGSGNTNNKFFAIWMDKYEREGPTAVIQTRESSGNSKISPYVRTRNNRHLGEETGNLFIDSDRDRGRWMQVVINAKMATSASSQDGVFELYRRWEDEQVFEPVFSYTDWDNYHVGGNRGFAHGYLMGWANATQPAASEWIIDDFTVSEENLLNLDPAFAPRPAVASKAPERSEAVIPKIFQPKG